MEQEKEANRGTESFLEILSDKAHNRKWINFARKELRRHKNAGSARHKEAEDYVEDAKLKILSEEGLPEEGIRNIDNYICGFIKKEISAEMKKEPMMIPLSNWAENEDEGENGEERNEEIASGVVGAKIDENLIVKFDDPFVKKRDEIGAWELMMICYGVLESQEPELLIIFDERAKGHPNREIAKYLHVEVSEVENMWKRVVRLLKKKVNEQISL